EFHVQIADYLKTLGPSYPKTLEEMIDRAERFNGVRRDGAGPNPSRWVLFRREAESGTLDDYRYTAVRDHILPAVRAAVEGMLVSQKLDAIVYPTSSRRPGLIAETGAGGSGTPSATNIANLTGFPDLIVPAGFTRHNLPVAPAFFGPPFCAPKLPALRSCLSAGTPRPRRAGPTPT